MIFTMTLRWHGSTEPNGTRYITIDGAIINAFAGEWILCAAVAARVDGKGSPLQACANE